MATTINPAIAPNFQPAFKRIQQTERHDDTFAAIATITGKTLAEVGKQAEIFGLPKTGPYFNWIDGDMIAKLLSSFGWVGTIWKECNNFKDVPELAIVMIDYDADFEVGRNIVIHRMKAGDGKVVQYAIDPYPYADAKLHLRTDLAGLAPAWYIGVHQQNRAVGK